ncbi:MAG: biotin synthase BioB [Candidatus Omnitrophota bacterium]
MNHLFYKTLEQQSLSGKSISIKDCQILLQSKDINLLLLLNAAFNVRRKHWGREVTIHIINNVQNGHCSENCHYCAQSKLSKAPIESYPMKSDVEIFKEAKIAYQSGAFRYCMVFSGREQGLKRIERLTGIIRAIKKKFAMEVCVSPGFVNKDEALILKNAGLDRLNHNINTSEKYYSRICSTHTFDKRLETLRAAQEVGLDMCSGMIVGMGEKVDDVIDAALTLRSFKNVKSIPINFFLPITGAKLSKAPNLSPEYCLRVLCLFRFLNPKAEIRMAAGREYHLRDMQTLGLYPANSLFMDGYLNVKGTSRYKTLQMIKDAGFSIKSEQNLDELIQKEKECYNKNSEANPRLVIKKITDLHPSTSKEFL